MHLNIITGDYIFYEWVEGDCDAFFAKQDELEKLGYKKTDDRFGFVNQYLDYENDAGDKKKITFCYR